MNNDTRDARHRGPPEALMSLRGGSKRYDEAGPPAVYAVSLEAAMRKRTESGMNLESGGRRAAVPSNVAKKRGCVRRGRQIGSAARLAVAACVLATECSVAGESSGAAASRATARAPFVYAADRRTAEISQFGSSLSGSGALQALTPKTVGSGRTPTAIAVSPQATNLYVVDEGNPGAPVNEVSQYSISPATGKLTLKTRATTGNAAIWITIAPGGTSAYIADFYRDAISQYTIPASGKLTPMSPATVKTPGSPGSIAVAPDGKYAYVADFTARTAKNVLQYRINPTTGALNSRPVATVRGGRDAQSITIAPDGKSAYVTVPPTGVWQYRISPATGRLSLLSPATVPIGGGTHDLAIAPNGKNAYVVGVISHTVSQYRINAATGALSRRPASTARTVLDPELVALAPDGKNAYVTGDVADHLSQYAISHATGKITPLSPATVKTPPGGSLGLAVAQPRR
jgi:6-phosphogluconolactonase (cycloisomerase 2 family)